MIKWKNPLLTFPNIYAMKSILSSPSVNRVSVLLVALVISTTMSAQIWTYRAGYGQASAANGIAEYARCVAVDGSGNVYMAGTFNDDLTPGTTVSFGGGSPLASAGDEDGFIAKYNSSGGFVWAVRMGGPLRDYIGSVAVNGTSVFVTGRANGAMSVGTNTGTTYAGPGTGLDGFVVKLDASNGNLTWITRFGGGSNDEGQSICIDPSGNAYVSGYFRTRTANATATFGSFSKTVNGNTTAYTQDMFVAKLNGSDGSFAWVSTGGSASSNDNSAGSGICYDIATGQVIVVSSFQYTLGTPASNTATYSSLTFTIAGTTATNEDCVVLELDASTGAFSTGKTIAGGDGNEYGFGITYDALTQDVFIAGSFGSSTTTFSGLGNVTNSNATRDNIFYGRYSPSTDAFIWAREVENSSPSTAADVARSIFSNGNGGIFVAGNFRNTITFPNGITAAASGTQADPFVARVNAVTGATEYVKSGSGTSTVGDDIFYGVAAASDANVWVAGMYNTALTLSPLAALNSTGNTEDVLIAKYADAASISAHPQPVSLCGGQSTTFSVTATGATGYAWQQADDAGFTTGVTTLTNSAPFSGVGTNTLTISDVTNLNGKYFRARVTNSNGTVSSSAALLTVTAQTLSGNATATHNVGVQNDYYFNGATCAVIDKVVPSGPAGTQITGSVTSQVWVEGSVPSVNGQPFVQRHYQITPATNPTTATATVTLYFTPTEFANFNAAPGSFLDLPTSNADPNKANLRVSKYSGTSSGGGLPTSYSGSVTIIDPADADIVLNTTLNRWEVTFDITAATGGFSGFFVQTALNVLPVNLTSFNAQLLNNDIQLKWKTTSETNNDYFDVEKSVDGRNFTAIGRRAGTNGSSPVEYNLLDPGAFSSGAHTLYYRLRIVSLSGAVEYSNVVIVKVNKGNVFVIGVQPNPFVNQLNLALNASKAGPMNVSIIDMAGRVVKRQHINVLKGYSNQSLEVSGLASGVYTLNVEFDGESTTQKIVKQ